MKNKNNIIPVSILTLIICAQMVMVPMAMAAGATLYGPIPCDNVDTAKFLITSRIFADDGKSSMCEYRDLKSPESDKIDYVDPKIPTASTGAPSATTPTTPSTAPATTPVVDPCAKGTDAEKATCKINQIFKLQDVKGTEQLKNLTAAVSSKKESTFSDVFATVINILSGVAVVMTFVGIVVAGGLFVFSEGEEGRITKARTIIIYTIVGDLIIAASYAIVKGITLIKPLQ